MENNKNILLISNFEKTYYYHKIFDKFCDSKKYFWYVVNKKKL